MALIGDDVQVKYAEVNCVEVKCVEVKCIGWRSENFLSNPLGKAAVSPAPLMFEDATTRTDFKAHC